MVIGGSGAKIRVAWRVAKIFSINVVKCAFLTFAFVVLPQVIGQINK